MPITLDAEPTKIPKGNSTAVIKEQKVEKKETTCICKEQYKDLVWGGKVSCDFRKKVIEIAKELWPDNYMNMASELMICMAVETGERFSPSYGYPNATGLIQFTGSAINDMNRTGYIGGKKIDKIYLKSLTAEKQLDYVKFYFQMWMINYKKTIKNALDMYLTIWCPAATGKEDTYVCYSEEKDKENGVTYYKDNKSLEYEYYDEKEPDLRKRLKKDEKLANKKIEKKDLKPRFKFWTVLGNEYKPKTFACTKKAEEKTPQSKPNSKIVHFDTGLTEDRIKVVSQFTISLLEKAAKNSANDKLIITSTIRSTRKQAEVMYSNESNGNHISYAAPGREVIAVFNAGKRKGDNKEKIISDMDNKIKDLSKAGRRVSLHCVSLEVYKNNNIIDISYTRGITNPRDLIRELVKDPGVTKIIHPLNNVIKHDKIKYDAKEPAIHVETKVP